MKLQTAFSTSLRCTYRSPTGRRCRLSASNAQSSLCPHHLAKQKQVEDADYFDDLSRSAQHFQTAQGINHSLGKLYELLARNQISARRAAVLSYIASLLLHTLPQIDKDNAVGIGHRPIEAKILPQSVSPAALEEPKLDNESQTSIPLAPNSTDPRPM